MKVSRKEYLFLWTVIVIGIILTPIIWLYNKWDDFWNKEVIEISKRKKVMKDEKE